ncbi:hypothetical protein FTX61_18720 [Nitriliruptoraceae bacterium ZYF776]|nr:hypothetical protein [Profundirhabdus halotolerans]
MSGAAHRAPTRAHALTVLLWVTSGAVLAQAALAGLFLSGIGAARLPHLVVGSLLPWYALVPAVLARAAQQRGACGSRLAVAVYALPVLLWVQSAAGHLPFAASTAVHVPLGVALAVGPAVLAVRLRA